MRIYTKLLFISVLFLSSIISAEENIVDESINTKNIPSSLQKISSPISLSVDSIFYNHKMEKRSLENFDNRFIILHFWASWCMNCQSELIALNKLQKEFRKKALTVIVISEDFRGISAIDSFFAKHQIDYLDIYLDKKNTIYNKLKVNHLPVSYLIDFDERIIARSQPGIPVDWDNEELKEFLEYKVSKHQLLPPEFKTTREPYIPPKTIIEAPAAPKLKSKLLIN